MKKILITLLCAIAINCSAQTTQRLILVEEFTNASCGPCALSNPAFETLMNANTTKVVPVKIHTSFPGYDPFYSANPAQNQARSVFYSITSVPNGRIDGAGTFLQDVNQTSIDAEYAVGAPFSITLAWKYSDDADSIYVYATFKSLQAVSGTFKGHIAVLEKAVHYDAAPGSNGEKDFTNLMRKMLPDQNGTALPATMPANQTVTVSYGMPINGVFSDISQIGVAAWVQDNATKNVKQAAWAPTAAVQPTNPYIILAGKTDPVCTNNGQINISVIGASGNYTYHWSNGATTQDLTGLALGTYTVTVTSGVKNGTATYTLAQGSLTAPTSIVGSSITSCSAQLNWAAKANASSYSVKYKLASSSTWSTPVSVTTTYYNFTGLTASTQYNFATAAVCASGAIGAYGTYTITSQACTTPTSPTSTAITSNSATINWNAACTSTNYEVNYHIQGTTTWTAVTANATTKILTGLSASSVYEYKIRNNCNGTYTGFSTTKTFITLGGREEMTPEISFSVSPNPVESILFINVNSSSLTSENLEVNLYDMLGRKCFSASRTISDLSAGINIPSNLSSGMYMLEVKGEGFSEKKQLLKQ